MTPLRWALLVATLGAGAWLLVDPQTADLAAQQYRSGLVRDHGLGLWNNGWFGGHHTPGYSVVFPPLGAVIGVRATGALAAIVASALFALIAQHHWSARASAVSSAWFALGCTATIFCGRLTFMLGVAVALAAAFALQRGRPAVAAGLAVLATLASPVAGLFLALAAVAWGLAARSRRGWGAAIAAAALAPSLALAVLFPEGGTQPFPVRELWFAVVTTAILTILLPARERALRIGAALYLLGCVAAFALATPVGNNLLRLGALVGGPILAGALLDASRGPHRSRRVAPLVGALALALAYLQAYPPVRDVRRASGDASTAASYHAPLVRWLEQRPGSFRLEIPYTANHWENAHVAPHIPLARGWERQLDRRYDALFYDGSLNAASYRAWLDAGAVAYVALPDVILDGAGREEAKLVRGGLPYLRAVWHDAHWQVFAVRRPAPMVTGSARAISLEPDGFTIRGARRGSALARVRHTRWWKVTAGRACVEQAPGGMTRVRVLRPGTVRVQARLTGSACRR